MEQKKSSTLGKAFSRAFGRKTAPDEPTKQDVPDALPASNKDYKAIDAPCVGNTNHINPPVTDVHPTSHNPPLTQSPDTAPVSHPGSVPQSPRLASKTAHDGTGLSRSNTQSRSGHNINNPEGGLNPANILYDRLTAYHAVIKNLQHYFNELAMVEHEAAKVTHKASTTVAIPFRDGQQFLGRGGLQDVCVGLRESSQTRSEQHTAAAKFIEETIVKNIRRLKRDIKVKSKWLKNDANLYATRVFKEREESQNKIRDMAKAIGLFENSGGHQSDMEKMHSDPYIINLALRHQLAKQVHEENLFARALLQCQEEMMVFDKHIIGEIKQIIRSFAQYQLGNASPGFSRSWVPAETALNTLQDDAEWKHFMERNGNSLFPSDLVDADPEALDYPCKNSPYTVPVKTAHMSRQSSVLKNWKDGYFVMTKAGWLHVFPSADLKEDPNPERSIYLPTAILGPHSDATQKQHVFSLEGKGMSGLLHRDAQIFTVRANSREEMLDWWSEVSKRAYSTMITHQGDGQFEAPLSHAGSLLRSSTAKRTESKVARPQSPGAIESKQQAVPASEPTAGSVPVLAQQHAPDMQQPGVQSEQMRLGEKPPVDNTAVPTTTAAGAPSAVAPTTTTTGAPSAVAPTTTTTAVAPNTTTIGAPSTVAPAQNVGAAPVPALGSEHAPAPAPGQTVQFAPMTAGAPQNTGVPGIVPPATAQDPMGAPAGGPGMSNQTTRQPPLLQSYDTGSTVSLNTGEVPAGQGA
ncbi:hypothetical protein BGX34_009935 [Mortierella sp. NVP85]|nr:hypothetical protein BGX34_009935 [Mortierella sp. NVP85]